MNRFNRRSLLGYSFLGAGAALANLPAAAQQSGRNAHDGAEKWIIDDTSAVAETESGKVIGYIRGGIRVFKGIPYAQISSAEGRWQRGAKVTPWAGKRSARSPGPVCPPDTLYHVDTLIAGPALDETLFRDSDALPWRTGEDCLRVHIWTPGLDGKKRPVLFWCHGGGFHNGTPLMESRLEGHNLSRYGDVVVVSVTHRLNALGFLDLTAYGSRYAESANLGMLDIVDALKWVQRNIANFGGDPGKVMVFGQSGGGGKVNALLTMPEAKGLFHRAVAESPGSVIFSTPQDSAALTAAFLKQVNVSPNNLDALHKIPVDDVARAAGAAVGASNTSRLAMSSIGVATWQPTVDRKSVLYNPVEPTQVSDVPLVIGSNLHENYVALGFPEYFEMKEPEARKLARDFYGPVGDEIYDVYRRAFPKANPFEVSSMARVTSRFRGNCVKIAQGRAAMRSAPTYSYWFQWRANILGGRAMSHHELEIPLVFLNSDAVPSVTGGTAEARALSVKMADSWLTFARTGNPNIPALPAWSPVTPGAMTSMVFDNVCRIDHGSDLEAVELYWKNRSKA